MSTLVAHATSIDELTSQLGVDTQLGLDPAEARKRLAEHGPNRIDSGKGTTAFSLFARQFKDPMVWLLLVAASVSGALLGEWIDAGVILAIVGLNATIGFRQESRAEAALASLKEMAAPMAVAIRAGEEALLPAADLVPGDVIVLEAGDRVPADARVAFASRMMADEAVLTGESLPTLKSMGPVPPDAPVGDRTSMVFAGTNIVAGRGTAVVAATGMRTEVGAIALLLEQDEPPTPLEVELGRVGRRIGLLVVFIAAVIFGVGVWREFPPETMFLTAVALAVAAIPEGLPAVVTITLAKGVQRMADRKAIVRKLTAVEALGAASVICTDKTGTLTKNEMLVQVIAFVDGEVTDRRLLADDDRTLRLVQVAALCNDARHGSEGFLGDPTEVALIDLARHYLDVEDLRAGYPRRDEIGFDSSRKRMSTFHETPDGRAVLAVKGAPEVLLERCAFVESATGVVALDPSMVDSLHAMVAGYATRGLRTLALAHRPLDDPLRPPSDEAEDQLVFLGVVAMSDEVREEAFTAVAEALSAGIRVVMVTGDHEVTATAVGAALGLAGETLGGAELRAMDADALDVERYGVYARVDPADKVKLVHAWQARGDIVAMTGDGVNDAPALNAADIGIAMGSGTDVAKDASSMVLSDDNFATIVNAVKEGRGIYSNLRKVVSFLLSANISEVVVMLVGFLLLGSRGEPLLATQLLWVNLVTDGLPALGLGVDRPAPGLMNVPPDRSRSMLSIRRQLDLAWQGSVLAAGVLLTYWWGVVAGLEWEVVRTVGFTTLVLTQLLHVWNVRAITAGPLRTPLGGNRLLLWGVLGSLGLHLIVVYSSVGQRLFETVPLGGAEWLVSIAAAVGSFVLVGLVRAAQRSRSRAATPGS